jgi:ferredoxin-NADP reductase
MPVGSSGSGSDRRRGVGITPILSILRTLGDRGDRRPQLLLFHAHTVNEPFMRQEITALRPRPPLMIVEAVDASPPGWREIGRIDARLLDRWLPQRTKHFPGWL